MNPYYCFVCLGPLHATHRIAFVCINCESLMHPKMWDKYVHQYRKTKQEWETLVRNNMHEFRQ